MDLIKTLKLSIVWVVIEVTVVSSMGLTCSSTSSMGNSVTPSEPKIWSISEPYQFCINSSCKICADSRQRKKVEPVG